MENGDHLSRDPVTDPIDHNTPMMMTMSENRSPSTIDESHLLEQIPLTQPQTLSTDVHPNTHESITETDGDENTIPENRSASMIDESHSLQEINLTQSQRISTESDVVVPTSITEMSDRASDDDDLLSGFTLSPRKSKSDSESPTNKSNDETAKVILRNRGAPKGKTQERKFRQFTKLIAIVQNKKEENDRRRKLTFKLMKRNNSSNLHYFQCSTHKDCTYWEMVRRKEPGHGDQRMIFTTEGAVHTKEFAPVLTSVGIHDRWTQMVDLLIDSGRTPAEIRTQLLLKANDAKDQDQAIKSLPTIKQVRARKSSRRKSRSMIWRLNVNADLLNVFQCRLVTTREQFNQAKSKNMIVWGVHTLKNEKGIPFSFMNFSTKEMLSVIPKAMGCYGKILPLLGDGVHKLVVHDHWLLVFWGFPSRRFDPATRKNR